MDYELAKELKDAGYLWSTHEGSNGECGICGKYVLDMNSLCDAYTPTLSELIEACGYNFYSLYRHRDSWQAHSNSDQWDTEIANGKTAEEAVARLWLALNPQLLTKPDEV